MAPRLHRSVRHDQEEAQDRTCYQAVDRTTGQVVGPPIPTRYADEAELIGLLDALGVNDLAGIEGAEDRVVTLSPSSTIACPAHDLTLRPDACRSCRFLAGET